MAAELYKISEIKSNPNNPRVIKDDKFKKLVQSLKDFPAMAAVRPIVVNTDMIVLGGNMRLKAMKEAGWKEVPVTVVDWSEEKQNEFIIKDNVGFGEWDWEVLANEWDSEQLESWGLDIPSFEVDEDDDNLEDKEVEAHTKLTDKFIVPPFSILDTRQGYWQERKKYWRELIGDNGESRENTLFRSSGDPVSDKLQKSGGVSILDPVLSELVNLWFGLPKSKTFDCFAGDSVFGYVSSYLGNEFIGIELRQEQADLNNQRIKGFQSKYICDDGQNVLNHIEPNSQDLLFSCPPYFDLEVYSDMPNDASNQKEYNDFLKILDNAFTGAIKCLKDNRFAVITVGDVRDKKGFYYRFVDDIKDIFKNSGVKLYNELILIETAGTAALRAVPNMKYRKVVKTHQNVLVFFKGDPKQIKTIYPKIEIQEDESTNS
jgi:DNA modification methylase